VHCYIIKAASRYKTKAACRYRAKAASRYKAEAASRYKAKAASRYKAKAVYILYIYISIDISFDIKAACRYKAKAASRYKATAAVRYKAGRQQDKARHSCKSTKNIGETTDFVFKAAQHLVLAHLVPVHLGLAPVYTRDRCTATL
jgi:hypothetical protein